jgi:hypothetical protein
MITTAPLVRQKLTSASCHGVPTCPAPSSGVDRECELAPHGADDGDERPVHHTADMRGKAETWVRERLDDGAAQECQQDDDDPVPYEPPLRIEHGRGA